MESVDDDDGRSTQALREQSRFHVGAILVSIADDQGTGRIEQGEGDQQFGLAAGFESHLLWSAELDQFFDDVALLIDLDRVDASKGPPVVDLLDRLAEAATQSPHAAVEDVVEADQQRSAHTALPQVLDQLQQIDAPLVAGPRADGYVARIVDREKPRSPIQDVVEIEAVANRPIRHCAVLVGRLALVGDAANPGR